MSMQHSGTHDSGPFPYEEGVFVSYARVVEQEGIVNEIDQALQTCGIRMIRDLGYRASIREFMERMGKSNCVIVVISDEYLRSPDCMSELMEIADGKEFRDRIFPIVLDDANIYDPLKRIEYVRYWEAKRAELAEAIKTVDPANLQGIRDDMDLYDRIRDQISRLTSSLKDMNNLTLDMHRQEGYQILADAIAKRHLSKYPLEQKKILDRRLDAAMPEECQVGQTTEVRVLIALTDSIGLKAFLPDYTISRELIARADVERAGLPIEFPCDQTTGQLLPTHLYVKIHAPDFQITQRVQQIFVSPNQDSGVLTFFLTPRKPIPIGRVSVNLYQDKECTIALGSVALTTTVSSQRVQGIAGSWQLALLPLAPSSMSTTITSTDVVETTADPFPEDIAEGGRGLTRNRWNLPLGVIAIILVAIIGVTAMIAVINIYPGLSAEATNTPVPPSPTPSCMSDVDPLVKFRILKNEQEIITINPGEVYHMQPSSTVEVRLEITVPNDVVLATPECTWTNAGTGTDGKFLQKAGCTVVYQSGHTEVEDGIVLQVNQASCPGIFSYAFFVRP